MHIIQLNILKKLLFADKLKYSQLKSEEIENSRFKFHMDKLISEELVIKEKGVGYMLSLKGKEFANRIKTEDTSIIRQAKLSTVMCVRNTTKNGFEYLIYTRLKNPFFVCQGFPTEKAEYGEFIYDAVKRGLKEETNLNAQPKLIGIRHYLVYLNNSKTLLEDKVMYIFLFENPEGELKGNEEGDYEFIEESEIKNYIKRPLEEFSDIFDMIQNFDGQISFKEAIQKTNNF